MKISILTPSLNLGKYLDRAIKSVLVQKYTNYEHIIVDGGSDDDTIPIIKKYDHLKYVSEPDKGQSDAMNKAFKMCTGDIIVYLNADDEFDPNAFEQVIAAFQHHPKADMIVGDLVFSDPDGIVTRSPSGKYLDILQYWLNLFPNNPVSYFYKRRVQDEIGEFPIDDHSSMDIWFLFKAYKRFHIEKINYVLGTFYSDGNNKTARTSTGANLHKLVKRHLKTESPLLIPVFYFLFLKARKFKF